MAALALALAACEAAAPAAPATTPSASAALIELAGTCAGAAPATFSGRGAELGYTGYRTCSGTARNAGADSTSVDVWVDARDAQGRLGGSCRASVGRLAAGERREWSATCPVTAAEVGFALRATDASGTPLPTRRP